MDGEDPEVPEPRHQWCTAVVPDSDKDSVRGGQSEVSKWIWTNLRAPTRDVGGAETAEEVKDSEEYRNERGQHVLVQLVPDNLVCLPVGISGDE